MLHYQIFLDCVSLTNLRSTGPWTLESVHLKGYFDVTGSREVITKNKVGRYFSMFPLVNSFTYFKTFYTRCIIFFFLPNFSQHLPRSLATWFSVHTLMKLPPNQNKQEKKPKCNNIKAQARKMCMKIHVSCFVFTTYSWAMGLEWFPLFLQILIANKCLDWSWILCLLPIFAGVLSHIMYVELTHAGIVSMKSYVHQSCWIRKILFP